MALTFDADKGQFINIDDLVADVASDTAGTICAWIDMSSEATFRTIFSFGDTNANERIQFYLGDDDSLYCICVDSGTTQWRLVTDSALSSGLRFVSIVQDGTEAVLYVDGVAVSQTFEVTTDKTDWLDTLTGIDNARIGSINFNSAGDASLFNSSMEDVRYYNRALDEYEIGQIYSKRGHDTITNGLKGRWKMNETGTLTPWDDTNCILALMPNSMSKGDQTSDFNTGIIPSYPGSGYLPTLQSMDVGYGYIYNGGDGYLRFDGNDDQINTTLKQTFTDASVGTWEFKFKYIDNTSAQLLWSQFFDVSNRFQLAIGSDDSLQIRWELAGDDRDIFTNETIIDGLDYTVHFIKDGANSKIYINGTEATYSIQETYNLGTFTPNENVLIGARPDGLGSNASDIYWVAYYDAALSERQILDNVNALNDMNLAASDANDDNILELTDNGSGVYYSAGAGYVADTSGEGNDGTPVGLPVVTSSDLDFVYHRGYIPKPPFMQ